MKRVKVKIYGRVQGVFFRANTKRLADELSVKGYVTNLADGTVEAVFEGDDLAVDKIVGWCHKGPPAARVEKVDVENEDYKGEFKDFTIKFL